MLVMKRASWEVQKKYHFALPRIKGIEKLIEGVGFTIVDSRQIMGMILYRHRGKVTTWGLMEGLHT